MGQSEHLSNLPGTDRGERSPRQALRGVLVALVGLALAGSSFAQTPSVPNAKFDKQLAWDHLVKQVEFGPRFSRLPGHQKGGDYILAEMKKWCENVREQPFEHKWSQGGPPVKMRNLIGEQNWKNAEVRVLLLAHWDTRPTANEDPNQANWNKPILGANDGASGVAVLLELMRVLKERNPKVGVMYLFTDGEDLGPTLTEMFLGARYFAANLPSPKPDYGILIDMIGDKDLRIPMEPISWNEAPSLMKAFYLNARQIGLGATFPAVLNDTDIYDDHLPLIQAGIPTIDLIDFTYPSWHTMADTVDKCSPDSLWKVGVALETWLSKPKPWKAP